MTPSYREQPLRQSLQRLTSKFDVVWIYDVRCGYMIPLDVSHCAPGQKTIKVAKQLQQMPFPFLLCRGIPKCICVGSKSTGSQDTLHANDLEADMIKSQ